MTEEKPTINLPMAALVALGAVSLFAVGYFVLPGASAGLAKNCQDAAEWHLQEATKDEASAYHLRAGQSFLLLDKMGSNCSDWELTKENTTTNEP